MNAQAKIQSRGILLEQHQNGKSVDQALEAVESELGPKAATLTSVKYWYRRFNSGDFSMGKLSKSDRALVASSKFLKMKRAIYCEVKFDGGVNQMPVFASNGRFQFLWEQVFTREAIIKTYWIVDTYHERKQKLQLDVSALLTDDQENKKTDDPFLYSFCFVTDEILLINASICFSNNHWSGLMMAKLDISTGTISITDHLKKDYFQEFVTGEDQPIGVVFSASDGNSRNYYYTTIDTSTGRLVLGATVELPQEMHHMTRRNDKLFGFSHYSIDDAENKLLEFSLDDAKTTEYDVKPKANSQHCVEDVWLSNKFVTTGYCRNTSTSSISILDQSTMAWKDANIGNGEVITGLSASGENVLIVSTQKLHNPKICRFYRFALGGPETLIDLSWMSMRRRARFDPEFYEKTIKELPTNSRLHCRLPMDEETD